MRNNITDKYATWLSENQKAVDHDAHVANLKQHFGTPQFQQHFNDVSALSAADQMEVARRWTERKPRSGEEARKFIWSKHMNVVGAQQFKISRDGRGA